MFLTILRKSILFLDFDGVSAYNSVLEAIALNIPAIVPDLEEPDSTLETTIPCTSQTKIR